MSLDVSVAISEGEISRSDHQSFSFSCTPVDDLAYIDEILRFTQHPVDFVVITRPRVDHDVLVAIEEHEGERVV